MIANNQLRKTLLELGYKATHVFDSYRFAAVDQPDLPVRESSLAAFFDSPPSYRNAALGVVRVPDGVAPESAVEAQRSLGAPYLIAISGSSLSAWTFTSRGPSKFDQAPVSEWVQFAARHAAAWGADRVRRIKTIQLRAQKSAQETLFDPTTLYTIQMQVQEALDALVRHFLGFFWSATQKSTLSLQRDYRILLPLAFRLLAAKILYDRGDSRITVVDRDSVEAVIDAVSQLYSLSPLSIRWNAVVRTQVNDSWKCLMSGLHVRNIAADDLAFVYENTLITPETRKAYGTHSTPAAVAEYIVRSFELPEGVGIESLNVYEPFAGSCVFLTAAMRRFKEILPAEWSQVRMHKHLVSHFSASEIDQFACEIARLSLILADYPNANGWHINNEDLFDDEILPDRLRDADMVVCNPPFEDFDEVNGYASIHKPVAALSAILDRKPAYLGIVLPTGFGSHKKYASVADRVVSQYLDVELLELPEGTFKHASIGAVALIAQSPRQAKSQSLTTIRKSTVYRSQRATFERTLEPSVTEAINVDPVRAPGFTGLKPLRDLWAYLAEYRRLGDVARVHRGLEWQGDQSGASSSRQEKGYRRGVHRIAESLSQFRLLKAIYLDCREESLRGGALRKRWDKPKILCSAIRMSRGPWRLAACVDEKGLIASQQFFGIWLLDDASAVASLNGLVSILNSPLANAFSFTHDPEKGLRVEVMRQLPLPAIDVGREVGALINEYAAAAQDGPLFSAGARISEDILMEIDAKVLAAYDLPPRLEKMLLKFMNEGERPCRHPFGPYPGTDQPGAISLGVRISSKRTPETSLKTWRQFLEPLPDDIADVFNVA